jgi:predicted nucleic acid-binding Zn finger protein
MELKCKHAVQKLKAISAYTKDYKSILDEYKKQFPNSLSIKKV